MTQLFQILVVDDEKQSRALVRKLLEDFPGRMFSINEAATVKDAMQEINQQLPDLIFLDVQMRGETGFDLLNRLVDCKAAIIFITAHSEFAIRAFRYSAMDYLLKPIDKIEFSSAVEKVLQRIETIATPASEQLNYLLQHIKGNAKIPDKLPVHTSKGISFLPVQDIVYCKAVSNYTEFKLSGNKKIISSYTLGYFDELLEEQSFFRIHRSYLINLSHVSMYNKSDGGSVIMNDGEEIEISRNNKEAFLQLFKG